MNPSFLLESTKKVDWIDEYSCINMQDLTKKKNEAMEVRMLANNVGL